jgi:CheY-like chemotaxis protein
MSPRSASNLHQANNQRQAAVRSSSSDAALHALRILIVDDNADAATSLGRLLSLLGHEIEVVHGGAAALARIEPFSPHAVLLDLGMPGMDGLETAERIRNGPPGARPVLIAITGWGQEQERRLTEAAGFAAHLTKPVNLDQLEAVLSQVAVHPA